jgi:hypothetical protein
MKFLAGRIHFRKVSGDVAVTLTYLRRTLPARTSGRARESPAANVSLRHLLAAFAAEEGGPMGELKRAHGITSASWRAALARLIVEETTM